VTLILGEALPWRFFVVGCYPWRDSACDRNFENASMSFEHTMYAILANGAFVLIDAHTGGDHRTRATMATEERNLK
jgi:hypothetical protein